MIRLILVFFRVFEKSYFLSLSLFTFLTLSVHFSLPLCLTTAQERKDKYERLREQRSSQLCNKLQLSVWSSFRHSCCKYYSAVGRIQWIMMYQVYMDSATGVRSECHSPWNPCYWSRCELQNKCIYAALILRSSKRFWLDYFKKKKACYSLKSQDV